MSEYERHEMQLQQSFPSGAQEWSCATCGRRVVIEHAANRVKIVALARGDEHAIHATSSGGLRVAASQAREAEDFRGPDRSGWLH
jgi:hypothetical protein